MSVKVKVIESHDPRLGRHVEHDERSRAYALVAPRNVTFVTRRWNRQIPVLDQGELGSCTGNAGLGNCGSDPFYTTLLETVKDWSEDSAVSLYSDATKVDDVSGSYPPDDTGSSGLAIAKVLKARGWISGYQHTFSLTDMKAALQNGPVIVGINWYNNFFYPDNDGNITIARRDYVAGGHEIVCDEIDMEKARFGFTNSWGTGWGLQGRFYISFDLMGRLLSEDGDVTCFVPLTSPAPQPSPEPSPQPAPNNPDVADETLWIALEEWAYQRHSGANRKAAQAVQSWARAKGLTT